MKVLVAEDDPISRGLVHALVERWGHEPVEAEDGVEALAALRNPDPPRIALLDWMMPGIDGVELCRLVRRDASQDPPYVILLTARHDSQDIVDGLRAGANDYITKPFEREELHARVQVGVRVVELQRSLAARVRELENALSRVTQLESLLPICCYCKRIRDAANDWLAVEHYVSNRWDVDFSHGICPACYEEHVRRHVERLAGERA
jgi:sigma-B regulation protein RsbU (phosphoserine phosphatase)